MIFYLPGLFSIKKMETTYNSDLLLHFKSITESANDAIISIDQTGREKLSPELAAQDLWIQFIQNAGIGYD